MAFGLLWRVSHGDRRRNMVLRGVRRDAEGELGGDRQMGDTLLVDR